MVVKTSLKFIFSLLLILQIFPALGQTNSATEENGIQKKDNVYAYGELLVGFISSATLNVEVKFASNQSGTTSYYGRVGGGGQAFLGATGGSGFLGGITVLKGTKKRRFDFSTGLFVGNDIDNERFILPILDIGYRVQNPGGFIFNGKVGILGVGIGLGYAF